MASPIDSLPLLPIGNNEEINQLPVLPIAGANQEDDSLFDSAVDFAGETVSTFGDIASRGSNNFWNSIDSSNWLGWSC